MVSLTKLMVLKVYVLVDFNLVEIVSKGYKIASPSQFPNAEIEATLSLLYFVIT
jgi:hypothetical protein